MSNPNQTPELYKQTLMRLGSMLKLLKQGDSPQNREKIQTHCDFLSLEGRKQNLFGWVALMETAKGAIAKPQHNYSSTTKLIIKEIKEAGEYLIKGEVNAIAVSDQLLNLAPSAKARFMDVETIYNRSSHEPQPAKSTLDRDLWRETLFTMPEKDEEEDLAVENQEDDSFNNDFLDTLNDKTNTNLDDWLEEDSFGSEDAMISSIFLTSKDTSTSSGDDLDGLLADLDDQDNNKVEADQWTTTDDDHVELNEEWDFLEDDQNAVAEGAGEISDELDDLFDDLDDGIDFGVESVVEAPTDNNSRGTVIVDDPLAEIEEDLEEIGEDWDIQAPPTVSKIKQLPLIYNDFEELDRVIVGENEHKYLTLNIDLKAPSGKINYYENFSELEKLVNTHLFKEERVNWQELEQMIANNLLLNAKMTISRTTIYPESQELEAELSDLDRLLAEAEKSGTPKARINKTPAPSTTKAPVFEQSMRVPVKQLDNLNNLVGEMVVRRNRLEEDQEKLRQFLDNLLSHVQGLSDVGARMQDMYERSLLEGALIDSRKKNQSIVKEQLARAENNNTVIPTTGLISSEPEPSNPLELDELELDRFTGFHLLSQEIIELIVRVRESTSDIQFLVDETDQLGRNLRQITTQLQEQINKSRTVPFAQNADRLPLPIRKIAQGYNKQVQLKVEGREVLIDKMILEHLWDPLLQIVKNSVTHGIEQPEERQANGKSPMGTITVRAFLQGPQTVISISDDGAGIDAHRVKQKAIQKNLITPSQAQNLKDQEVYEFLFNAGFSTKDKADSHAGRGVGLDIVRTSLNEIRGSVSIDSTPGQGTTFTIRLPLTLSIGKALCCLNDNARIAFPIDGIEDTQDFAKADLKVNKKGEKCIPWEDSLLPLCSLSSLLTYNRQITRSIVYSTSNSDDETIPVIILRGGNNLLAIQVDEVLGQEEIVIKQITGPLPKPKGIAGATVRSDGTVMAIGDVIELIEIAQGNLSNKVKSEMFPENRGNQATMFDLPSSNQPFVLIVDDSITVREMLSMTFSKSGYRVEQARDGQEAWQKLKSGLPCDLIFSDIEMPRMNGLELLQHIQEDADLARIPVAILSSRGAQRHQKIAAELGASAYLIKPCVDKDLIDSARRMVNGEVLLANSTRVPTLKTTDVRENIDKETNSTGRRRTSSAPLVLVIDDSVVVREMLSMTFKKAGYEVEQARDGQDAWDKISDGSPYDLLLCDIEMPRMNGLELLARMQQDEDLSKLPVAMVTSRGAEKHRRIAADLGAKAYFTKPYLEDDLLEAAQKLIKGEVLLS